MMKKMMMMCVSLKVVGHLEGSTRCLKLVSYMSMSMTSKQLACLYLW